MEKVFLKIADNNTLKELETIGFDASYKDVAVQKYKGKTLKIYNLRPYEANILKQLCLSLGFDCAVSKETIMCNCEKTDALIFATETQLKKLTQKLYVQPFKLKELANKINFEINEKIKNLSIRNYTFDWSRPYIMGILNVTPDSFSDGGKYMEIEAAINHCKKLIKDGADIIDIGGESTKPNAKNISVEEEINRVIPVIKAIRCQGIDIPISIDTRNFETVKQAILVGADIINDVSGLEDDNLFKYVGSNNIPTIFASSKKNVEDIYIDFYEKISALIEAGMDRKNIIIDSGIGFNKTIDENFEILKRHNEFESLKCATLIGISRKSFITKTFSKEKADEITALYSSKIKGVNIHRVHNVKLVKEFLNYSSRIND